MSKRQLTDDNNQQSRKSRKRRDTNIKPQELEVLIDEVVTNYDRLYGKINNENTSLSQSLIWASIAEKIRSVSPTGTERTESWLKAKVSALKSQAKFKLLEINKYERGTGGGPPPPHLTNLEEKIRTIIFPEEVIGISGAKETGIAVTPIVRIVRTATIDAPAISGVISTPNSDDTQESIELAAEIINLELDVNSSFNSEADNTDATEASTIETLASLTPKLKKQLKVTLDDDDPTMQLVNVNIKN